VEFVDAPVSGGVNAAAAGTLTFMVGADSEAVFNRAKLILDSMGAKVSNACGRCLKSDLINTRTFHNFKVKIEKKKAMGH
jgi:6-phosphogluconate dehydrogenase (decarboxylating)